MTSLSTGSKSKRVMHFPAGNQRKVYVNRPGFALWRWHGAPEQDMKVICALFIPKETQLLEEHVR